MSRLFRLFLALTSTYFMIVIFLIDKDYLFISLEPFSIYYSWVIFISFSMVMTLSSLFLAKKLPIDHITKGSITELELANNNFLPAYLGYFFVALSVQDIPMFLVVYLLVLVFTFVSQTLYFNPLLLLLGYHFYYLKTSSNIKILLISKQQLKSPDELGFNDLKRINNYTFIDL